MNIALMKCDKHPAVGVLQRALNDAGATPRLDVDNDFGNHTKAAVQAFQARTPALAGVYGGLVCDKTMDALRIRHKVQELVVKQPIVHVETENWAKGLKAQRFRLPEPSVNPNTGNPEVVPGQAWQLSGYESLVGGRIDLMKKVFTFHSKTDPDRARRTTNECALLVQAFGCGKTRFWRRGPQVKACSYVPVGTVIATLRDGVYYGDHSGRSHVGIFHSKDKNGITMIDQFCGGDIKARPRLYDPKQNGDELVKQSHPSKNDDLTIPVTAPDGSLMGYTVAHVPTMKNYKYAWVGDGDEYYVMYSDNTPNLELI